MNKVIFPAALASIVVIAGIFAFMPVQDASTVHNVVLARTANSFSVNNGDNSATIAIIAEGTGTVKHGWICADVTDAGDTVATALVRVDVDPDTTNQVFQNLILNGAVEQAGGDCQEFAGVSAELVAGDAGDTADVIAIWSEGE